jgi:hypothetical protein
MMKIKVELAQEIDKLKKSSSVWISAFFAILFSVPDAISYAWRFIPDDLKAAIPGHYMTGLAGVAFALTFIARILRVKFQRNGDQNADQADGNAK